MDKFLEDLEKFVDKIKKLNLKNQNELVIEFIKKYGVEITN